MVSFPSRLQIRIRQADHNNKKEEKQLSASEVNGFYTSESLLHCGFLRIVSSLACYYVHGVQLYHMG